MFASDEEENEHVEIVNRALGDINVEEDIAGVRDFRPIPNTYRCDVESVL